MIAATIVDPAAGHYRLLGPVLSFHVIGLPIGQGQVSFLGKGRPAIHTNQHLLLPWRQTVAAQAHNAKVAAQGATTRFEFPLTGPVGLAAHFTMPKPKAAPKRKRTFPITRPDLSHLVRAIEDALQVKGGAGVYGDDSQIVDSHATKHYPGEHVQALDVPGVVIYVYAVGDGVAL